jgi:hypothetical protein
MLADEAETIMHQQGYDRKNKMNLDRCLSKAGACSRTTAGQATSALAMLEAAEASLPPARGANALSEVGGPARRCLEGKFSLIYTQGFPKAYYS